MRHVNVLRIWVHFYTINLTARIDFCFIRADSNRSSGCVISILLMFMTRTIYGSHFFEFQML